MAQYTRSQLKNLINSGIQNRKDTLTDFDALINRAARKVVSEIDLRSLKRKTLLNTGLLAEVYEYPAPADLKAEQIIDIEVQQNRDQYDEYNQVSPAEFSRKKEAGTFAIANQNGVKRMMISGNEVEDYTVTVSSLDNLNAGGGIWQQYSGATTPSVTYENFVRGSSALSWGISSSSSTKAGIYNSAIDSLDLSSYLNGYFFVWQYISNKTNINSFTLDVGTDVSNFRSITVTTNHADLEFELGWNLLRFPIAGASETGTVSDTDNVFLRFYMNKDLTKVDETGYITDHIMITRGYPSNVHYYSYYPWISNTGAYKLDSTEDTDLLVADIDEYDLFVQKGIELAARDLIDYTLADKYESLYKESKESYQLNYPSEIVPLTTTYHEF